MNIILKTKVAIALKYYTKFAKGEISGMGKSIITKDKNILVTDIILFEQECSGASTDLKDEAQAKFMYELGQRGESLVNWNLWWHTHADMNVFWSTKDDTTIEDHAHGNNFLISVVTNKANEYKGRLDIFPKDKSPFGKEFTGVKYDLDVEVIVDKEKEKNIQEEVEKLEDEKVDLENLIIEIDKKIIETNDKLLSDTNIKEECKTEVIAKVKEKTYKKKYQATNNIKQEDFENALDDILYGMPLDSKSYNTDDDPYDNKICPECQNPIMYCQCNDAFEKYQDFFEDCEEKKYLNKNYRTY